jgi:hypothetical protein
VPKEIAVYRCALVMVVGLALPQTAAAQNALGDGTGLQQNTTNYGPNARPPARYDIMESIRFRNAVVTGNVPMGKHFRGEDEAAMPIEFANAGAAPSPFEFRGGQASDSTFAFRRDSLFSGIAGTGIRGTDALQYQLAITTASAPPPGFAVDMLPQRDGQAPSAGATLNTRLPIDRPLIPSSVLSTPTPEDARYDALGRGLQDLRSTASYRANQTLQPELHLQTQVVTGDVIGITSSELRGVRLMKFEPEAPASPYAAPSLAADDTNAALDPLDTRVGELAIEPTRSSYDNLMAGMQTRVPDIGEEGVEEQPLTSAELLEVRLAEIRDQLANRTRPESDFAVRTLEQPDEDSDDIRDDDEDGEEDIPTATPSRFTFDPETVAMIRETGGTIDTFVPVGKEAARDLYAEHMLRGQQLIADKRFFDAEARFTAALSVRPSDPMASIGRVHAQLGAGMFESAAINLRRLLVTHPEVAGVRYADDLMPSDERYEELVRMLRTRRDKMQHDDPGIGLLVAYIGYQSENDIVLRQGLDILIRADRDLTEQGLDPDALSSLIVEVWTPAK